MGWLSEFHTKLLYVSDIEANSFAHFQISTLNSEKDKYLKKRKNTFWNQYKIVQYEIQEDEILRGSSQSSKSNNERLLLKILGERALVNNFLEYLHTAKILYFILTNLALLLPFFILLFSICLLLINCTNLIRKRITCICTSKHCANRNYMGVVKIWCWEFFKWTNAVIE